MACLNLTGMSLDGQTIGMITKYNFEIDKDVVVRNINRLTNQVWKLIPMLENEEDWEKQLNTVIIEIAGLHEIFSASPAFLQGLSKLEGLRVEQLEFEVFRKTVFEIISILQGLKYE